MEEPPAAVEEPPADGHVYVEEEEDEPPVVVAEEPEEEAPAQEPDTPVVSVVEEDEEPHAEAPPADDANGQNPIANELLETVNLIVSCYDETGVPPAVTELHGLISSGEYEEVRSEITNIWNSLLKYHQQTGTRLQHQVTTTFNTINSIVRKMDRAS